MPKSLLAGGTSKRLLVLVHPLVRHQIVLNSKGLFADGTGELLIGMQLNMPLQTLFMLEGLFAGRTGKRLLVGVY